MIQVVSKNNPLPEPIVLSPGDFLPKTIDQLERYEGMRVQAAELTAVSPGGGRVNPATSKFEPNGTFFAVLTGTPRPYREPGLDYHDYLFLSEKDQAALRKTYPKLLLFDSNPERIRIESTAQPGSAAIDASTFAEIKNLSGVLHYGNRAYSILVDPDSKPAVAQTIASKALPPVKPLEFLIASMNIENFFDDVDDPGINEDVVPPEVMVTKMRKISGAVRLYMQMPDVIGIEEAENLAGLKRLAERINSDCVSTGKPDPKYEAYLIEGNDSRGIDVGFLVKSSRVKVIEVKQLGKDDKYLNPVKKEEAFLNDRPPLMLRFSVAAADEKGAVEFTAVVNHLKSYSGYSDPKVQDDVRLKKRLQSEFLAKWVQERQKANPSERIALVGDFNSYQFEDGIMDMIGTIKGTPPPKDAIFNPSEDLVDRDLTDLVDLIPIGQRYSYSFDGNAQVLDHIIINEPMKMHIAGFAYARLNADFPEKDRFDGTIVQRFSDHDIPVAYFSIEDLTKK
jgi:predicted extracellular nuclease